jgi:hypothetical protein
VKINHARRIVNGHRMKFPDNLTGGKMTQAEIEDEFDNFDINNPTGQ